MEMAAYNDYGYSLPNQSHTARYLIPPIEALLNPNENNSILDIGCGNGWLARHLIKMGYNIYGIDASETGISIAKGTHPDRFFVQDLSSNTLPNELLHIPFDTIISTEVIEHLYSPRLFFQFCHTILSVQPSATIILTTPYHGYLKNLVLALSGKMDAHFTVLWEGGHIKFWSKKTLTQALQQNGFEVVQFVGCGRLPWLWKSMAIKAKLIK